MIYIIRTKRAYPSFIKVGYSDKIFERISSIQTGCPYQLELIKKIKGGPEDEKRLHKLLKDYSVNGEWFRDCKETMDLLGIKNPRPLSLKREKEKFRISPMQKMINKKFSPRDYFGHRKRCSFELFQFCERNNFKVDDVMEFHHRYRNYDIKRMTFEEVSKNHNFLGDKFDGVGILLIPRPGHRHNSRKQIEAYYCAPVT